jgi:transcriptional regulator with XRE-family HTH domain
MNSSKRATLGAILMRWKLDQRLTYAAIARPGMLSRNTVKKIADGSTPNPSRDTICKLAVGLAIDPGYGTTDKEVLTTSLREMWETAGYEDDLADWLRSSLEVLLTVLIQDRTRARGWLDLAAQERDATAEQIAACGEWLRRERSRAAAEPEDDDGAASP